MSQGTSQDVWKPSTTQDSLLGDILEIGAVSVDTTLFYTDSGGAYSFAAAMSQHRASTDLAVVHGADTGALRLQYVNALGAITQGEHLGWTGVAGEVDTGTATTSFAGVALQDVAIGEWFWMAIGGQVDCLIDAGGIAAVGNLLINVAAGAFDETGAVSANAMAVAEETIVGAGLAKCRLL